MSFNIIYALRNKCNDKTYIGQTWQTLTERSKNGYKGCFHLRNAITKYGWDQFYYEILTITHTQECADYWEEYFINKFNSQDRTKGYNIRDGGFGGKLAEETKRKLSRAHLGKIISEETKKKLSLALKGRPSPNKGRKATDKQRERLSEQTTGRGNPNYGKHHSEETKKKIASRPYARGEKHAQSKFSEEVADQIRADKQSGLRYTDLMFKYKISHAQCWRIVKNRRGLP